MTRNLQVAAAVVATLLFATPAIAGDNELSDKEKQDGWKLLFNGQDLS